MGGMKLGEPVEGGEGGGKGQLESSVDPLVVLARSHIFCVLKCKT